MKKVSNATGDLKTIQENVDEYFKSKEIIIEQDLKVGKNQLPNKVNKKVAGITLIYSDEYVYWKVTSIDEKHITIDAKFDSGVTKAKVKFLINP